MTDVLHYALGIGRTPRPESDDSEFIAESRNEVDAATRAQVDQEKDAVGDLARVAGVRKQLLNLSPQVFSAGGRSRCREGHMSPR